MKLAELLVGIPRHNRRPEPIDSLPVPLGLSFRFRGSDSIAASHKIMLRLNQVPFGNLHSGTLRSERLQGNRESGKRGAYRHESPEDLVMVGSLSGFDQIGKVTEPDCLDFAHLGSPFAGRFPVQPHDSSPRASAQGIPRNILEVSS